MTRSSETAPPPENPRDSDGEGGWSGFLSESSEELQGLAGPPEPLQSSVPEDAGDHFPALVPERGATPAPVIELVQTISLDEIVSRQVLVLWSDAVAIVEELCLVLLPETSSGVPEARDVSITSEGRVVVARGARRDRNLSHLGVILQTLLPALSTPLALRLFVTSSMSPERCPSIQRYAEALAHYAAPDVDRTRLIRDLCRRSLAVPVGLAPVVPINARVATLPPRVAGARSRVRVWGTAAAAVLALGVVVAVLMSVTGLVTPALAPAFVPQSAPASAPAPSSSAASVDAPANVEAFLPARAPAPVRPVIVERAGREVAAPTVPPQQPPHDAPKSPPDAPALQALPLAPPSVAIVRAPPVSEQLAPRAPRETSTAPAPAPAPVLHPAPVATSGIAPEPRIYSIEDRDVDPPVLLSPGPPILPMLSDHPSNTLEIVVDERGRVLSVKLVSSARLIDQVVLSPAKNMQFRPALRNGTAVRYRLNMKLPTSPH